MDFDTILPPLELWIFLCRYFLDFKDVLHLMHSSPYLFRVLLGHHGIRQWWFKDKLPWCIRVLDTWQNDSNNLTFWMKHPDRLASWSHANFINVMLFTEKCSDIFHRVLGYRSEFMTVYTISNPGDIEQDSPLFSNIGSVHCLKLEIRKRYFDDPPISIAQIQKYSEIIKTNGSITCLTMIALGIDTGTLPEVINMLEYNNHIPSITLCANNIGDDGACVLAVFLTNNTTLKYVNVNANGMSIHGIMALINATRHNKTLRCLGIGFNIISEEEKREIRGRASKINPALILEYK